MSTPKYISVTSVSTSETIWLDYNQSPFNASVSVTGSSSGTFSYTVQYTLDSQQFLSVLGSTRSPVYFSDANLVSLSSNATGNYMFPVAGVRISVSALSSATVTMCILQGGPG